MTKAAMKAKSRSSTKAAPQARRFGRARVRAATEHRTDLDRRLQALLKFDKVSVLDQNEEFSYDELRALRAEQLIMPLDANKLRTLGYAVPPGERRHNGLGRPKLFYVPTPKGIEELRKARTAVQLSK
jgi:hypothetical protein